MLVANECLRERLRRACRLKFCHRRAYDFDFLAVGGYAVCAYIFVAFAHSIRVVECHQIVHNIFDDVVGGNVAVAAVVVVFKIRGIGFFAVDVFDFSLIIFVGRVFRRHFAVEIVPRVEIFGIEHPFVGGFQFDWAFLRVFVSCDARLLVFTCNCKDKFGDFFGGNRAEIPTVCVGACLFFRRCQIQLERDLVFAVGDCHSVALDYDAFGGFDYRRYVAVFDPILF